MLRQFIISWNISAIKKLTTRCSIKCAREEEKKLKNLVAFSKVIRCCSFFSSRFTEINSFMHARWKLIYCRRCVFCSKLFLHVVLGCKDFNFLLLFLFLREKQTKQRRNVFDMQHNCEVFFWGRQFLKQLLRANLRFWHFNLIPVGKCRWCKLVC